MQMVGKIDAVYDQRSETIVNHVHVSKLRDQLYETLSSFYINRLSNGGFKFKELFYT